MVSVSPNIDTYSPPPGHVINALIVDDNDFDRRRIKRFSEKADLPILVHEATSLSGMKDALKEVRFDIVLLDYQLADGDGLDALRILNESANQIEPGVIMITGNERTDIAVSAFRNGCKDFVSKSIMSSDVMRSAMLRTLSSREEGRLKKLTHENFEQQVESAVVASLTSAKAQDVLSKIVSSSHQQTSPEMDIAQQIELEQIFRQLEDDDEFHFGH